MSAVSFLQLLFGLDPVLEKCRVNLQTMSSIILITHVCGSRPHPLQGGGRGRGGEGGGDVPRRAIHVGSAFSHAAALLFHVSTRKRKKTGSTQSEARSRSCQHKPLLVLKFNICTFNLCVFIAF